MPVYEFECDNTEKCEANLRYDKEFSINDSHEVDCPLCGAPMRKIYSSVPTHFKGSGFYSTDSK